MEELKLAPSRLRNLKEKKERLLERHSNEFLATKNSTIVMGCYGNCKGGCTGKCGGCTGTCSGSFKIF
jgi:hypothetical protein